LQVAFIYWHRWRITMILHTCKPTSGFTTSVKTLGTYVNWCVNF
jgi:hypothetical protein